MRRITNIFLFTFASAYSFNALAQPEGLGSFLRGEDPNFDTTSLLNSFQQQATLQAQTLDSVVLVTSGGDHYVIPHFDFAGLSQLSPTIAQYISDLNEMGSMEFNSIPLPVSSQSIELLIQGMQSVGNLELAIQYLQRGGAKDAALAQLENDATWLDSTFLLEVVRLAKHECERYFGLSVQVSESEEELPSEEKVPTFEELFPKGINTFLEEDDLKILDSLELKGNELQKYIRTVHHILVRKSQIRYLNESDAADFLGLIMVDRINHEFPQDPNHLSDFAQQFLIYYPDITKYIDDLLYYEYKKENPGAHDQLIFALESNVQGEVCCFEGVFGEIFCKDEKIEQLFSCLIKSFENYLNAQNQILDLIRSKKDSKSEIMSLLGTRDLATALHRIYLINGVIEEMRGFVNSFKKAYPNLMSLYLISQYFTIDLDDLNRSVEAKPNSRKSKSRCNEQKDVALLRARYHGLEAHELALQVLKPYVDQFLQIIGEEPSILPIVHQELRRSARFHASLVETATKELKNVPKPKQKQITTPKKKAALVEKPVVHSRAKRPEPNAQPSEPEIELVPPKLPERDVESTTQATTTVKPEKREPKKREEKRDYKKTEKERARERAEKRQKVMDEYNAEREKREQERARFRVVLSPEESKLVISGLCKDYLKVLEEVFAQPSSHLILTDKHFTLLAKHIQKQMNIVLGKESTAFMDAIKERIHYAHDSKDTGDKLPGHYVDILRTVFIIFGVIPEGWEPKTREDRAIVKNL